MSITVADLLRDPALALRLVVGPTELELPVSWAHVSELADPTPYLEGGELLLTTGPWLRTETDAPSYVARLTRAGVAGIGFGAHVSHETVPDDLVDAAREAGLALLEVPPQTPFIAVSKAVSRALAAAELQAVTAAYDAQRALTNLATRPDGPQRIVTALHRLVGGWVVLADERRDVLAASPASAARHAGALAPEISNLRRRGAATATLTARDETVLIYALERAGAAPVYLATGTPALPSSTTRQVVNTAAALLTLALSRHDDLHEMLDRLIGTVLVLLRSDAVAPALDVLADLGRSLPPAPRVLAVVAGPQPLLDALHTDALGAAAAADEPLLAADRGDRLELLIASGGAADEVVLSLPVCYPELRAGVSTATDAEATGDIWAQAQEALARTTATRTLVNYRELTRDGFLDLLPPEAATERARQLLAPLLTDSGRRSSELLRTLRAWLEHHGQWDATAVALQVHRHTVHTRIAKVQELLGQDLQAARVRVELWAALALLEPTLGQH